jgi:hypothetical protein
MLNPDHRQMYTDALRPPPGYRFGSAVAAAYSLDLETLLTIPLHLALFSAEQPLEHLLGDGIALLEALRRTTDQVTVFAQASRVLAPTHPHVLYGLLEPTVIEALPPAPNGSFHPKIWVIRFQQPESDAVRLRLIVLTRNLTADRSWDLALTLEGAPGDERIPDNAELVTLIRRLPQLATRPVPAERAEQIEELATLAGRTEWELPGEFNRVRFHTLGLNGSRAWLPRESDELIVLSPFLSNQALHDLLQTTDAAPALISRPQSFAMIDRAILEEFDRVLVLAEQAELEDGEEGDTWQEFGSITHGLHAKGYLVKRGWDTHLYVGSANATNPALVYGANVELVAELIGRRSKVGAVTDLLNAEGFGALLADHDLDAEVPPADPALQAAEDALERLRRQLVGCGMTLVFDEGEAGWRMRLRSRDRLPLGASISAKAWLATRRSDTGVAIEALSDGQAIELPHSPLSLVTSFVAFELRSTEVDLATRFVLNLPTENMPVEERDGAIVRDIIGNREGFLRYVMLLLVEAGEEAAIFGSGGGKWGAFGQGGRSGDELPLFENLTRTFCRDPKRLESIRRLMEEVGKDPEGGVVPPEFLDLWHIFEAAHRVQTARDA